MEPGVNLKADSQVLKALAHPVRLKMVMRLLARKDCNVTTLAAYFKLPQSTISQHLAVLKHSGVVAFYKCGTSACYSVIDKRVVRIIHELRK
ncbi:MAG: winged helix-turn-helix transcriptional regulator, partial [Syntrophaceae bacterium]|nr:winged helix-turn-helix transcriptional regulator [Syntrophaceae bacterium]